MNNITITLFLFFAFVNHINPQSIDNTFCGALFKMAANHAKKKDHDKNSLLNRLVEKINPIDRIEKGWDEINGRNKTELPRQMTLDEIRKRGLQLQ